MLDRGETTRTNEVQADMDAEYSETRWVVSWLVKRLKRDDSFGEAESYGKEARMYILLTPRTVSSACLLPWAPRLSTSLTMPSSDNTST